MGVCATIISNQIVVIEMGVFIRTLKVKNSAGALQQLTPSEQGIPEISSHQCCHSVIHCA
jgi:hypothetical protein